MSLHFSRPSRRAFLGTLTAGSAFFTTRGLFAEQLALTPPRTEGPFYPDKLPLDQDNDLIIVKDGLTPAVGEITHLTGRVLTASGSPIKNVTVEIWQCDANQVYLHTGDSESKGEQRDKNFQGFGKFTTGSKGEYYFRTIKPVPYPGRPAPHIHFKRMMEFDTDKDGKLTKVEITDARLLRLFDRSDANKDGIVTKEELASLAAKEQSNEQRGGPPGFGGGPPGFGPRGGGPPGGGPPGGFMMGGGRPGEILPRMIQERLKLTPRQKTRLLADHHRRPPLIQRR
ncbi:MAG TPA: hypothetical protein VKA15_10885 [Isosphaeraceae bacterium]|nr:hypothetical protein [Isosphaeraceae bacterium]